MATLVYTKKQLIERIRKHVADGFPNDDFAASSNEILLYIDSALAANCIGQIFGAARVTGNMATPEAYLTTYNFTNLTQDPNTNYWYTSLPQTPVSLPLGYSINRVYFTDPSFGVSNDAYPVSAKELSYLLDLPMPFGIRYWVEGSKIWVAASNGAYLLNLNMYVNMIKTRTDNINESMNLPDDAIDVIFTKVVGALMQRYGVPQDIVKDDLPAGNKSS